MPMELPEDLQTCVAFHGHLCPGLVYGYRVAKEAIRLLNLKRSHDEEVVAICENDSCAVDALQVLLGTTAGKGNLTIKDYGKNAYTVLERSSRRAYRFSRKHSYHYTGGYKEEFERLDRDLSLKKATDQEKKRQKQLKSEDLMEKPFMEVFSTRVEPFVMPSYAPMARSEACSACGEMTMSTKMVLSETRTRLCIPCADALASK